MVNVSSVQKSCDDASRNGSTALTDVKAETRFDGERVVYFADHFNVVAGHDHLRVLVWSVVGPKQ